MSRCVMLSIRPEWCRKMLSGEKKIEIRKSRPKIETPFKCYIYQTLPKWGDWNESDGHVVGEFICDWIKDFGFSPYFEDGHHGSYHGIVDIHKLSCVSFEDMFEYIGERYGFGWHISGIKRYKHPKHLHEFELACDRVDCKSCKRYDAEKRKCNRTMMRPFQSWGYVEELHDE